MELQLKTSKIYKLSVKHFSGSFAQLSTRCVKLISLSIWNPSSLSILDKSLSLLLIPNLMRLNLCGFNIQCCHNHQLRMKQFVL